MLGGVDQVGVYAFSFSHFPQTIGVGTCRRADDEHQVDTGLGQLFHGFLTILRCIADVLTLGFMNVRVATLQGFNNAS